MSADRSVADACLSVLVAADPAAKVRAARAAARDWRLERLAHRFDRSMPDEPARPSRPELMAPRDMPRRRKAQSLRGRVAMLHALAHIEFVAIDLAFDLLGRFGGEFPAAFVDDWMRVGAEEAMHFALLDRRLRHLGSCYGALPAHDGLWQAARETAGDAAARLAIVPMVLEARALDITPATISSFRAAGDETSACNLSRIMGDEINHVAAGTRWFDVAARNRGFQPVNHFHELVIRHFHGSVKAPFNDSAREEAGLTREYYIPLATRTGFGKT